MLIIMNSAYAHVPPRCSAAILAGGAATRMGGVTKGLLDVLGRPILDTIAGVLAPHFEDVMLVVKEEAPYQEYLSRCPHPLRLVRDGWDHRSSLTGIHAALEHSRQEHCFITACDTPLLRPALLQALLAHLEPDDDVVLPLKPDGYFEPLCAIYSRRCLPHITAQLERQQFKIIRFFDEVRLHALPPELLLAADPDLVSFKNANTPEELTSLRQCARGLLGAQEAT